MSRNRRHMESEYGDDTARLQYSDTSDVWPKRRFRDTSPNDFGEDSPEPDPFPLRHTQMWNTDKMYSLIWHKVNALNGVCSIPEQTFDQMSEHLSSPDAPFWNSIGMPGCIVTGFMNTRWYRDILLRKIIPQDEFSIMGACIWFRSTGVLPSNFEEAEKIKLSPPYLLPLKEHLGDLMEYERCGVIFPPLISEVYELISLGEKHLYKEASAPQELRNSFKTWKSTSLASDWSKKVKVSPSADSSFNIFECFMLYVHNHLGHDGAPPHPDSTCEPWNRYRPDLAQKMPLDRPTDDPNVDDGIEMLEFIPRLTTVTRSPSDTQTQGQIDTEEKKWMLPYDISRSYVEAETLKYKQKGLSEVDEPKASRLKLHIEPVAHCMMVWMSLTRLKDLGWAFSKDLQELYDAIEWYLVLAESQTPCHMWDQQKRRPTHIPFDLPGKPEDPSEVVRESQYDRQLFNQTYAEYARTCTDSFLRYAAEWRRQEGERGGHQGQYLNPEQDQSHLRSGSNPDEESDLVDSESHLRTIIYPAERPLLPPVTCEHRECSDTLRKIDLHIVKLEDDFGKRFESLVKDKGLSEALKEMRMEKWDPKRLKTIRRMHCHRSLILGYMEECSGLVDESNSECKLRAMVTNNLLDDAPPAVRRERQHWARWRLREPSVLM